MKVLLTGATGFTGGRVLALMRDEGMAVRCLVRSAARAAQLPSGTETAIGDIGDGDSMQAALRGCEALVNTASIGFGHGPALVRATEASGVKRALFVSTTAIFTTLNARTKSVRRDAEEAIVGSALDWTIVRPTMIYGSGRDRNMCRLIRLLARTPLMPVIGSGRNLQQPVYVDDVARALLLALGRPVAIRQAYNVAGAAPLTFNEVIDTIAALLRKRVFKVRIPVAPVVGTLRLTERAGLRLPVKSEQLLRLNEDKAFDIGPALHDLGYAPFSFAEGIAREIRELGLAPPAVRL
jgi:nucleoside-diphosphate-sugar epimerase